MPQGPGKYDTLLTQARLAAGATAGVLIILDEKLGPGVAVQIAAANDQEAKRRQATVAALLQELVDAMKGEAQME